MEIKDAVGKGRRDQVYAGYPKGNKNMERLFPVFPTGALSTLEEYPIIPDSGVWDGCEYFSLVVSNCLGMVANCATQDNQGKYRVITKKGTTKNAFVGVVQHGKGDPGPFLLCNPAPAPAPACTNATTRSVVRDLWYRATKGKGKGKGKGKSDASASCKKPKTKKPKTTKPKTKKPKTTKTKKTKAKVPKTKGKKKGGKL